MLRRKSKFRTSTEIFQNFLLWRDNDLDLSCFRLKQDVDEKPLVVILSWLQSKQKHLSKYAKVYMDQGFDVLVAQITPWQLLWPVKGSQVSSISYHFISVYKC